MDNKSKKVISLKNGIRALIIPIDTELTNVSVSILLGQNHEKLDEMEVTHYMEHLMGRLTSKKYNDYKAISKELNRRGAIKNAFVTDYETNFFIQGFYKDIEFYLDLLQNTINNFHIEKSILKQEKNAVIQELRNLMANHTYMFNMKIWKYMYSKYAYQYDNIKHIQHIEQYDTNKMIQFIHNHILSHNIIVSITCPLDKVMHTEKLFKKYFNFTNRNRKAAITYPIYQYDNDQLKVLCIKHNYNDDNAIVRLMIDDSIKYLSKEHLCMTYLKEILFNFETGIFYKILRDKLGLIYNISMQLYVDMVNPVSSSYYIETSVSYKRLPLLINAILDIIKNLHLTDDDIESGKQKFIVKYEFKKFNDLTSYNTYYGKYLLHKLPIIEPSTIKEKYLKVKNSDIRKILNKFKHDVLTQGLIFYYSKHNMNAQIEKQVTHYKIKYVVIK